MFDLRKSLLLASAFMLGACGEQLPAPDAGKPASPEAPVSMSELPARPAVPPVDLRPDHYRPSHVVDIPTPLPGMDEVSESLPEASYARDSDQLGPGEYVHYYPLYEDAPPWPDERFEEARQRVDSGYLEPGQYRDFYPYTPGDDPGLEEAYQEEVLSVQTDQLEPGQRRVFLQPPPDKAEVTGGR